jgi:hypothetical protein
MNYTSVTAVWDALEQKYAEAEASRWLNVCEKFFLVIKLYFLIQRRAEQKKKISKRFFFYLAAMKNLRPMIPSDTE